MGIMEKKMEITIVYWGFIWIMEKKMDTTIMGYIGVILGRGSGVWRSKRQEANRCIDFFSEPSLRRKL